MAGFKKPKGVAVVSCKCSSGGWPILVLNRHGDDDYEGLTWPHQWHLKNMEEGKSDVVRGQCPHCGKIFHARFPNSYKDFAEELPLLAAADDIPGEAPPLRHGVKSAGFARSIDGYYEVIEIRTPDMYVVPLSKRKAMQKPYHQGLYSRTVPKLIYVDGDAKQRFVFRMIRWRGMVEDPTDPLLLLNLPDWRPSGTEDEFQQWADEVDALLLDLFMKREEL